ncbi:alpha-D-ribose 1-methylphosphonate 5-triphosphate diphosphatase [Azospirillum halopraeferens]|uniref:alpha-D-ribose 1-methylphosphonate 5-triphosphate diphosphatase n=1 Tax=Azospirillum halopraeferens TaxID=34010 RepID=UPI00041609C8|nr:alpha-D-ribose 1-methylphosphonate 5-triphosphate diphosphatase [Azospirillum halopraeferens]
MLTNARIVGADGVFTGTLVVRRGRIAAVDDGRSHLAGAVDLDGDHLVPGLVELHTDNLERHLMPRPGVVWPAPLTAVLAHDAQIVAAGITTVLDAVCVGEHRDGGGRRAILDASVEAIRTARDEGLLRADHALHLRCEVADPDVLDLFAPFADDPLLRLVSLMDHTPGQRQWTDLTVYRRLLVAEGWAEAEVPRLVAGRVEAQARFGAAHRLALAAHCRRRGIAMASHDDATPEHVAEAVADGIRIAEFPTTRTAAEAAHRAGLCVVMGAPNLVRGGSHSGNVAAADLAAAGLLDALSSDYVPGSLLEAAFRLHTALGHPLHRALATVSAIPAAVLGLDDRGSLAPGLRADVVRVGSVRGHPLVRAVWCAGERRA